MNFFIFRSPKLRLDYWNFFYISSPEIRVLRKTVAKLHPFTRIFLAPSRFSRYGLAGDPLRKHALPLAPISFQVNVKREVILVSGRIFKTPHNPYRKSDAF